MEKGFVIRMKVIDVYFLVAIAMLCVCLAGFFALHSRLDRLEEQLERVKSTETRTDRLEREQNEIKAALISVGILEQIEGGGLRLRTRKAQKDRTPDSLQSVEKPIDESEAM